MKPLPHIVMLLADDFGWGNIGYHHDSPEVKTPQLDALKTDGIELTRHYAYKFCSPSRSAFQSGRLPVHVNTQNAEPTVRNPDDPIGGYAGIPVNMTSIAHVLKRAGYATHFTGKWDVGMATWRHTPLGRGYDSFLGYFHHANDYWTEKLPFTSTGTIDVWCEIWTDIHTWTPFSPMPPAPWPRPSPASIHQHWHHRCLLRDLDPPHTSLGPHLHLPWRHVAAATVMSTSGRTPGRHAVRMVRRTRRSYLRRIRSK